jgi:CubicO group peptidase (beta-lactamase class C family)
MKGEAWPTPVWTRLDEAEVAGWSSDALVRAWEVAADLDVDSLLLVVGGRILDQWGDPERKLPVHSIRKSLLNALYGIAIQRGLVHPGKTLDDLGIDDKEGLSDVEKQATILDLMTARSGVYHPTGGESGWMKTLREPRGSHGPGTFWVYNNWDFNALGTIYEQETGRDLFEAFRDDVAKPLGMEHFRYDDEAKDAGRAVLETSVHPMTGFTLTATDLARFGLLYLREGRWGADRVLPHAWVRQSVLPVSDAGLNGAYGYLWWVSRHGLHWPGVIVPEGTFSARGWRGHRLVVVPPLDLVLVLRVDTREPGPEVTATQFGRLLAAILEAAPTA